jgi:hypothetical protein
MKATIENLQKTERQINKAFYCTRNEMLFFETKNYHTLSTRWNKIILKLRGFNEYESNGQQTSEWSDYCKATGIDPNYNLGDILA